MSCDEANPIGACLETRGTKTECYDDLYKIECQSGLETHQANKTCEELDTPGSCMDDFDDCVETTKFNCSEFDTFSPNGSCD